MAAKEPIQSPAIERTYENAPHIITTTSQRSDVAFPLFMLVSGLITIGLCIAAVIWLWLEGPVLVPGQDTRITAIVISVGRNLAAFFISTAIARSAWATFLPRFLDGNPVLARTFLGICRDGASLRQLENYPSLPTSFKIYIVLAAFAWVGMTGTSASFRYETGGASGRNTARIPDFPSSCNTSLIQSDYYSCTGLLYDNTTDNNTQYNINGNTTTFSWSYIEQVNSGGQGTVSLFGNIGDERLGAQVTLAVLPSGWYLNPGSTLPWMAMSVSCSSLPIAAEFSGSGLLTNATIIVNGSVIDYLDIAQMPQWNPIIHMYQQWNDSGPLSNLSPWILVMLNRDINDFAGLADDAATYLGNSSVDLHGYPQPVYENITGAAAYCEFDGSTGGQWPDELWPSRGDTSNFVIGTLVGDRPTMGTGVLNYGPSWQYTPVSSSYLPGGSVSYIANNTGPGVSFPDLFASYIRNQWALTAYAIAPQSYHQVPAEFDGAASNKLFISVTIVALLPLSALILGLFISVWACFQTIRERRWVNRVVFESWWLVKALRPDIYGAGYGNATKKELESANEGLYASYNSESGYLYFQR